MVQINTDMTPKELMDRLLPELISSKLAGVSFGPIRDTVQIHIPDTGHWAALVENGAVSVRPGKSEMAYVTVVLPPGALMTALERATSGAGDLDAIDISGPLQAATGFITQELIDSLRAQIQGTIRFTLTTASGTDESLFVGFGGINTDAPTCTVQTTETDLFDIVEKGQSPQEAFMAGKVRLDGDMSILMGLVANVLPLIDTGMTFLKSYMKERR